MAFSLRGNPVCTSLSNNKYCQLQPVIPKPYSTSLIHCGGKTCSGDEKLSPSCACAVPYQGILYFRAPLFRDLTNSTIYQGLESDMSKELDLTPGSVLLQNPSFSSDNYLEVKLALFPASGEEFFSRSKIQRLGFQLSGSQYAAPPTFGSYYFYASPYPFPGNQQTSFGPGMEIQKPSLVFRSKILHPSEV